MDAETLKAILEWQWPAFTLLVVILAAFWKFLERTYSDHKEQMQSLQATFRESLGLITNTFGIRLDKIEETLENYKK